MTFESVQHGYSVLRLVVDELRNESLPVGVAVWDAPREWYAVRVLADDEELQHVGAKGRKLLRIARSELDKWATRGRVPYAAADAPPWSTAFWTSVSRIMSTAIRVDQPKAIDPVEADLDSLEGLYEAVIQPKQKTERRATRIDGALSRALAELADEIPSRPVVQAFGRAKERVLRGVVRGQAVLLLDGVNLAGHHARQDADALVSRLRRIRRAYADRDVTVIVGYTSSPGGLNGETHMRDWIREELTSDVFDLLTDQQGFHRRTELAFRAIEASPQESLLPSLTTRRHQAVT